MASKSYNGHILGLIRHANGIKCYHKSKEVHRFNQLLAFYRLAQSDGESVRKEYGLTVREIEDALIMQGRKAKAALADKRSLGETVRDRRVYSDLSRLYMGKRPTINEE